MRFFPIFMKVTGRRIVVSGAGETALAKLRLLLKTEAVIHVFGANPIDQVNELATQQKIILSTRDVEAADLAKAIMVYGANDDPILDQRAIRLGRQAGALANIVDNLDDSDFITAAMVDRDPVTIAIGTEGAAPVLARHIKKQLEESLPSDLGQLTRLGQSFRPQVAHLSSKLRRIFWSRFYFGKNTANSNPQETLDALLRDITSEKALAGHVTIIGAGPGDPDLLTMKARNALHEADVVIHDALVPDAILELARREAVIQKTGKRGFKSSWSQDDINNLMIEHAKQGRTVIRLKGGDPTVFARLDEELTALEDAGVPFEIIPGVTSASAAAASIGQSLTQRGRNSSLRILTGHDVNGMADHDWRTLAQSNETAAIYMGKAAARFISGRLIMHGANPDRPVTVIANASRPDQRVLSGALLDLPDLIKAVGDAPTIIFLGLHPRQAEELFDMNKQREQA